jgi:diacylglycerol kinase family enzyme
VSPTSTERAEQMAQALELGADAPRRRALVIVNPYATTVSARRRQLVVRALGSRYEVAAIDTQAAGHATEICREAAWEGYDVVVAFGGDGTVNEVINGLAGSPTPITCLPGGRTNVYCRLLGIPAEIVDATEHLLDLADCWAPRRVDLGRVNGRLFAFSAGVGIDASVVAHVDANPALKARFGASYFLYTALRTFVGRYARRPPRMIVRAGGAGETVAGVTAIVQNGEFYTYFNDRPVTAAAGGGLESATLAGLVLRRAHVADVPAILGRALFGRRRLVDHPMVHGFAPFTELVLASADGRPLPLQVDGDYVGDVEEARFDVVVAAVCVVS